jgi:phage terminase large subunit
MPNKTLEISLLPKQKQAMKYLFDNTTNEILFGGGVGGAKSTLGSLWLISVCLAYPETRWLMGRATLKTLKETTLNTLFQQLKKLGFKADKDYSYKIQEGRIVFNNGSEILLKDLAFYPSDPEFDELGSLEITGAFIDEVAQITAKCKTVVKSRIRYKLTEYKLIPKILYTCNPSKNWSYTEFYLPSQKGELAGSKKFIQALPTDNKFLTPEYLESLRQLPESSKRRLYDGDWEYDDDPAKLIEYNKILDLFTNDFVETGQMYITADIARLGKDKTVIMIWSGWRVIKIVSIAKSTLLYVQDKIIELQKEYKVPNSNTIVDEDGVGGGVKDNLKCQGFVANSSPLEVAGIKPNYQNLKTQCHYLLADKINNNGVFVNCNDPTIQNDITQELEQIKGKNIDKDGKIQMVGKDEVKKNLGRSPDYSDTLAFRCWFELKPKKQSFGIYVSK